MTDKMREKFEAAVEAKFKNVDFSLCTAEEGFILCVGEYKQPSLQTMWWAWQAALGGVETEYSYHRKGRCSATYPHPQNIPKEF